jgi:ABC-2 type transport system permease protein
VTRVLLAAAAVAGGIVLANLGRLPLVVGAGAVVGAPLGLVFGGVSWAGLEWALVLGAVAGLMGVLIGFTQVPPLASRELNAFFYSPIAYVVGTVFLVLFGLFYYVFLVAPGAEASMTGAVMFTTQFILPIVAPILTMKLLAEEKRSGTMEVLMTAPVRDWEVVLAKYAAAVSAFLVMLAPTLIHVLGLYLVSETGPARSELIGGYVSLVLMGGLYLALGTLASALSRDQIVAAILGFAFSFLVFLTVMLQWFARDWEWIREHEAARRLLEFLSPMMQLQGLSLGRMDTKAIVYFLSLIAFVLFLTVRVVESRKWR